MTGMKEFMVFLVIPLLSIFAGIWWIRKKTNEPRWTDQHEIRFLEEENERLDKENQALRSSLGQMQQSVSEIRDKLEMGDYEQ